MEINITAWLANNPDFSQYSGSIAELGNDAGQRTWDNAKQAEILLDSPDKLEAMRRWALSSGGWDDAEIAAWSDVELNALFIQLVSGDIRGKGELSWPEYQAKSEAGQVSGCLFEGIDGQVYYSLEG